MAPRWIGYATVFAKYVDYSRAKFLAEARKGTWGPIMDDPTGVKVSEAAVRRWSEERGQTTRALVRERIEVQGASPESEMAPAVVGKRSRAEVGRAGAIANSTT